MFQVLRMGTVQTGVAPQTTRSDMKKRMVFTCAVFMERLGLIKTIMMRLVV